MRSRLPERVNVASVQSSGLTEPKARILKFLGTKRIAGKVTAFESNSLIELTTYEGALLPKITHTFKADGDRTIYARRIRFETSGLPKLLEPLMKLMPRNPNTRTAENLKLVLEGGQPR
jgi:hypothetical protein